MLDEASELIFGGRCHRLAQLSATSCLEADKPGPGNLPLFVLDVDHNVSTKVRVDVRVSSAESQSRRGRG